MRAFVFAVFIAAILIGAALGDMPLPLPSKEVVTSPSGRIRAVSDPKNGTSVEDLTRRAILWRIPE